MTPPRVFISYSHDSDAHRRAVLELSDRLRRDGVLTVLDRYVNGSPEQGWPRWMLDELEASTHVLCVCTSDYYRRFRGHDAAAKGVNWEGAVITQEIYDSRSRTKKFIPVFFDPDGAAHVPEPLRPRTYYRIDTHYEALYDEILGQAGIEAPPVGERRTKPRTGAVETPPPQSPAGPTDEELACVHEHAVAALDSVLTDFPPVAKFFAPDQPITARFAVPRDGGWRVADRFRQGAPDVRPVLESASKRVAGFEGKARDWDALEQVVGGVLVLGINPRWLWEQREKAGVEPVLVPSRADAVHYDAASKAHFLASVSAALASGYARLDRIFGSNDRHRAPDIGSVMVGITASDRADEIKRHFIRFVLGPTDEFEVDALRGSELNTLFNRVRQLLLVAREIDKNPFYAVGPNLAKLATEVKSHIELRDLYLFVPEAVGDESALMNDPVVALNLASRLHEAIKKSRPAA